MKRLLLILCIIGVFTIPCFGSMATCTWKTVTTYADGTSLPAGTIVRYKVYRDTTLVFINPVLITDTTATFAIDTTVQRKTQYYYFAVAYIAPTGKESARSVIGQFYTNRP